MSRRVEQRRHERFQSDLMIKLERGEALAQNVSAGGIYFLTDQPLKTGQELKLTLEFPDAPGGAIAATCTACVVRTDAQGARYGVAVSVSKLEFRRVARSSKPAD